MNGQTLKNAIISGANNICSQKSKINDLNIFPVPDGDTGTNMSMTITAAMDAIENNDSNSASEIASVVAKSMLRGARGNSGVITSLLFRGFAQGLAGKDDVDGKDIAIALGLGVDAAYKAVAKPTEGTILTVARVAYEKALEASEDTNDVTSIMRVIVDEAGNALAQTPEMLPVLKKAGVVDAGGKGLLTIFEGMLSYIEDGVICSASEEDRYDLTDDELDEFRSAAAEFDEVINFTYCTEFIVGRDSEVALEPVYLREFLEKIGDCVVVVDDEDIIKVHVHTDNPGDAIQMGLEYGQLLTVKVENMKEQHRKAKEEVKTEEKVEEKKLEAVEPTEDYGFVAVVAGDGLKALFEELGCLNVVSGGQSMNPSTDDIYDAIMATPAKTVYVFPNNKNIIMAASQTIDMVTDRKVVIVPTKTVPQGITAMISFDPTADADSNVEVMTLAAKQVSTGQVTYAARDSEFGSKKIKEGEIIGLDNGKLTVISGSPNRALYKLVKQMINDDMATVTVYIGEDVSEEEEQDAVELFNDKFGDDVDFSFIRGDQPVYYYIVSIE